MYATTTTLLAGTTVVANKIKIAYAETSKLRLWGEAQCAKDRTTTHDHSECLLCFGNVSNLCSRFSRQPRGFRPRGVQGILIVLFSFISMSKRSVHVCPTKGVRTYVSWEQEPMHSGVFGSRTILS